MRIYRISPRDLFSKLHINLILSRLLILLRGGINSLVLTKCLYNLKNQRSKSLIIRSTFRR